MNRKNIKASSEWNTYSLISGYYEIEEKINRLQKLNKI